MKNARRFENLLRTAPETTPEEIDELFKPEMIAVIGVFVPLALIEGYEEDTQETVKGSMAWFKDGSALVHFDKKILVLDMDDEEDDLMFKIIMGLSKKSQNKELH
jgi:hypothetical protein